MRGWELRFETHHFVVSFGIRFSSSLQNPVAWILVVWVPKEKHGFDGGIHKVCVSKSPLGSGNGLVVLWVFLPTPPKNLLYTSI